MQTLKAKKTKKALVDKLCSGSIMWVAVQMLVRLNAHSHWKVVQNDTWYVDHSNPVIRSYDLLRENYGL